METAPEQQYLTLLYERLRAMARARMSGQAAAHTLDPTGLANEAVLRLMKCEPGAIRDEQHFFALAAEAMRQILVDHARAKRTDKRGGGARPASLAEGHDIAIRLRADPNDVLALNEALKLFEADDPEAAMVVKMKAFAGMDSDEVAALLSVSKRTVERRWRFAMADLRVRMTGNAAGEAEERDAQ